MANYVAPEINNPASGGVLIVGRDPGEQEEAQGRPFVGPAGELLDEMLTHAGWRRQDVNIANVVPYRPFENKFGRHNYQDVRNGVRALRELIERLQPNLVIALGNEANYTLVDGWPTRGNGIFGAQDIEERRGYFWQTKYGIVLSALHPAAVARKEVPGKYLLETDFRRARKYLDGKLPFEQFPETRRLERYGATSLATLSRSRLIGWDIETKWGTSAVLCSGFCGDDLQPYVGVYPKEFEAYARYLLESDVPKVGHNGFGFDIPALQMFADLRVKGYAHDTQLMWASLEPEIAGTDEAGGDEQEEIQGESRLTRKGLAFLPTMYNMNFPWWKDYPDSDEHDYLPRMIEINGRDCFITRILAETMLAEILCKGIVEQYKQKLDLIPVLSQLHVRGIRVDDGLRQERLAQLEGRKEIGKQQSKQAAMVFIQDNKIEAFGKLKKCRCCGGGKAQAQHCWRCSGFEKPLKRKTDYHAGYIEFVAKDLGISKPTMGDLRKSLLACETCKGTGKVVGYDFNPFSPQHQTKLLVHALGAPKHTFKGKDTMDETALKRILKWAQN